MSMGDQFKPTEGELVYLGDEGNSVRKRGYIDYAEKLLDPRWKAKAMQIVDRYQGICGQCGDRVAFPEVHHRWYEDGREPWEYPDDCFEVYCRGCHELAGKIQSELAKVLSKMSLTTQEALIAFVTHHDQFHLQDVLTITDRTVARQGAIKCIGMSLEDHDAN